MSDVPRSKGIRFVSIQGIDGAGKTSIARQIVENLNRKGTVVKYVHRLSVPDSHEAAERLHLIGSLLWNYPAGLKVAELGDRHLVFLMASWYHLFDKFVVVPALQRGRILITDHWVDKYLARFHVKDLGWAVGAFDSLTEPDLTLLLDVSPEVAAGRKFSYRATETNSDDRSLGQFTDFQSKVRHQLMNACKSNWQVIDADGPFESVVESVLVCLTEAFHLGRV